MLRFKLIFFVVAPFVICLNLNKASSSSEKIKKLITQSNIGLSNLGVYVVSINQLTSKTIIEINGNKQMIPASLMKLATAGAVLDHFSPGHQFVTQLQSEASIKNDVLEGDLYLVGGGDSGFVSESMWLLVNEFIRSGIKEIQGDIIVDATKFDAIPFSPSREAKRVDRAFDAPVGAMSFNWNSANIYIRPGLKKGDPVQVWSEPESSYITIVNRAKTSVNAGKIIVHRKSRNIGTGEGIGVDRIVITGTMGLNRKEKVVYRSISKPGLWSGHHLRSFLTRRGIVVRGGVKVGSLSGPSEKKILADIKSRSMGLLVQDMMKFSNNYVAEMLTKNLSHSRLGGVGTIKGGVRVIDEYLIQVLAKKKLTYTLVNPSGLSRKNRMSVHGITEILLNLKRNFSIFPEFVSSLPISGWDGTLKGRMKGQLLKGWVRAKTGTLNGVTGLSGFAGKKDGTLIGFAMLYNGPHSKVYTARSLFNKIIYKSLY